MYGYYVLDLKCMVEIGDEGVFVLISDLIEVEKFGYNMFENIIEYYMYDVFVKVKGRFIVLCYVLNFVCI